MDIIYKFEQLVEQNDETDEFSNVDLSLLLDEFSHTTPISVPYTDTPASFE